MFCFEFFCRNQTPKNLGSPSVYTHKLYFKILKSSQEYNSLIKGHKINITELKILLYWQDFEPQVLAFTTKTELP